MKRCPECGRDYNDDSLSFCLDDGAELLFGPGSMDEPQTAIFQGTDERGEAATRAHFQRTDRTAVLPSKYPGGPRVTTFDKRLFVVPVVVAILAAGGLFFYRFLNNAGRSGQINSIAVLPLNNNSVNPDSEYLSDGLAESLIYRLSQLPNLKVSSASSVMRYKGQAFDAQRISSELGVQAILSGRLTQRGDNLSISVELINAATNNTIWGEQYDRKMSDLLATQREIATTVAEKLELKLAGSNPTGLTKRYTESNEAYQNYLRGRHYWNKRTKDAIEQSIVYFQKAIDLDPSFALAHVGVADAFYVMPAYAYMASSEAIPRAIAASRRAMELDPNLAEAHSTYGSALTYEFRWGEAESEIKRSLDLDPNSAQNHYRYSIEFLVPLGRLQEANAEITRALEIEPLSIPIGANRAGILLYSRNFPAALEQALKVNELEPGHATATYFLGWSYVANGKFNEALDLCEKGLPAQPNSQDLLQIKGYSLAKIGRSAEARRVISKLLEMERTQYVAPYRIATLYTVLGDKEMAFAQLDRSYQARDWDILRLKVDPFVDELRDDPRFARILQRLNLPE